MRFLKRYKPYSTLVFPYFRKSMSSPPIRKIIHIDMDAFYASVEQRDHPEYRGKPIAVGGSSQRGVVAAASYEARKFGVRSAMPSVTAAKLCQDLVFVKPRFDQYKQVSKQIMELFKEYTDLVEPLSLDEAYLNVTENKMNNPSATLLAQEIRKRIWETVQLTASAGISYNKFLAKTASDINKPNGYAVITPQEAEGFIENLPIEKFFGVGKKTAEKMRSIGIFKGKDLKDWSEKALVGRFGKQGHYYYHIARGIDEREVKPNRIRKSIGVERTFSENLHTDPQLLLELNQLAKELEKRLQAKEAYALSVTLKIKYADFEQITRAFTPPSPVWQKQELLGLGVRLLEEVKPLSKSIRLMGLTASKILFKSDLKHQGIQLKLYFSEG